MSGGRGQWIMEPPVLNSILYVTSWKFQLLRQVPKVNHILDPGRRFWTEAKYQRRIFTGKNLVFIEDANQGYRLTFEVTNLILCQFPGAFWQRHSSGIYDLVRSRDIAIAQRRA